jgi:hypothetical protein
MRLQPDCLIRIRLCVVSQARTSAADFGVRTDGCELGFSCRTSIPIVVEPCTIPNDARWTALPAKNASLDFCSSVLSQNSTG